VKCTPAVYASMAHMNSHREVRRVLYYTELEERSGQSMRRIMLLTVEGSGSFGWLGGLTDRDLGWKHFKGSKPPICPPRPQASEKPSSVFTRGGLCIAVSLFLRRPRVQYWWVRGVEARWGAGTGHQGSGRSGRAPPPPQPTLGAGAGRGGGGGPGPQRGGPPGRAPPPPRAHYLGVARRRRGAGVPGTARGGARVSAAVAARGRSGTQDAGAPRPCLELTSNPCLIRMNRAQGPKLLCRPA